jgi:hypothetical protein
MAEGWDVRHVFAGECQRGLVLEIMSQNDSGQPAHPAPHQRRDRKPVSCFNRCSFVTLPGAGRVPGGREGVQVPAAVLGPAELARLADCCTRKRGTLR